MHISGSLPDDRSPVAAQYTLTSLLFTRDTNLLLLPLKMLTLLHLSRPLLPVKSDTFRRLILAECEGLDLEAQVLSRHRSDLGRCVCLEITSFAHAAHACFPTLLLSFRHNSTTTHAITRLLDERRRNIAKVTLQYINEKGELRKIVRSHTHT